MANHPSHPLRCKLKAGRNPDDVPQVVFIDDAPYFMTYRLACEVAAMSRGKRRTWLGRNWRRARPVMKNPDGSYRLKSGTRDV